MGVMGLILKNGDRGDDESNRNLGPLNRYSWLGGF